MLLAQRALLRATDEQVPQALANWRPTVNFTGQYGMGNQAQSNTKFGTDLNVKTRPSTLNLQLNQPVYTGGRTGALERAARAEHEATGEDLAAARADLRLEVTRAFWALVTARETERVVVTVDKHANTSAASVPLAFDTAVKDGRIKRGDVVVLEAMGGGFTWGAAALRY